MNKTILKIGSIMVVTLYSLFLHSFYLLFQPADFHFRTVLLLSLCYLSICLSSHHSTAFVTFHIFQVFFLFYPWFAWATFFNCLCLAFLTRSYYLLSVIFFVPLFICSFISFQSVWILSRSFIRCFSSSKSGSATLFAFIFLILSALIVFPILISIYLYHWNIQTCVW